MMKLALCWTNYEPPTPDRVSPDGRGAVIIARSAFLPTITFDKDFRVMIIGRGNAA